MSDRFLLRLAWLCVALAACSSRGGQTGEEGAGCFPIRRDVIALDAPSPLGFSGADVLAEVGARQSRTLNYETGATSALELAIDHAGGSVAFVKREFRSDGSGREIGSPDCGDVLELELTLSFETADGAFDETWPVVLVADSAGTARVQHVFDPDALSGSYSIEQGSYDDVSGNLSVNLVGMTWTGSISGQGEERGMAANPDSVASATHIPIGTF